MSSLTRVIFEDGVPTYYALPADRTTVWQPGVTYNGGIPNRTTIFTTITATGTTADRTATIQAAIAACPANQVVLLGPGDFYANSGSSSPVKVNKDNITLRGTRNGTAVGQYTRFVHPNGANSGGPGSNPQAAIWLSNTDPFTDLHGCTYQGSALGWQPHDSFWAAVTNLTAEGLKGSYTINVASTAGFAVGDLVRLDELDNASYQAGRTINEIAGGVQIWAAPDFRVAYVKHNPSNSNTDDFQAGTSNITGAQADAGVGAQLPSDGNSFYRAYTVPARLTCEMKKIAAIGSGTITFETPLHINYRSTQGARIAKYAFAPVRNSGIENISATGFDDDTFMMKLTDGCWISGCEATDWHKFPFEMAAAYRSEIRRSIHRNPPISRPSSDNYGYTFMWATADCLIEDCIGHRCDKVIAARAGGAGCVVGYNYLDCGYIDYNANFIEMGVNASHLGGNHHVLFEGNYSFNGDSDFTHGNTIYALHYRNWYRGVRHAFVNAANGATIDDINLPSNGPKRCGASQSYGSWHSFVGNVLGVPGAMSGWNYEFVRTAVDGIATGFCDNCVWGLGWDSIQYSGTSPYKYDPGVLATCLRDGNFDYLTSQVHWHSIGGSGSGNGLTPPAVSTLPNSLYAPSKPAFFGSSTFPWVAPEGATKLYTLPAKTRFDSGDYFT